MSITDTLRLILQIAGGATATLLPPGVGKAINVALSGLSLVDAALAEEAKLRGIPPDQLREQLIVELDKSIPQTRQNILDRIERIKNS